MSENPNPPLRQGPFKAAPKLATPVKTRNAELYWSLFGVAVSAMGCFALLSIGADMLESGWVVVLSTVAAFLPVPVYVALFLWLDRFEPEPPHLLVGAFAWGVGLAGLFACVINSLVGNGLALAIDPDWAEGLTVALVAPPVEEMLKGSVVAILFFWKKSEFDGITDGIIYAGMAALGFAAIENVSYYGRAMNGGAIEFSKSFLMRGVLSPYAHVLFTAMTGIGFGIARQSKVTAVRVAAPLGGLLVAIGLHFLWNLVALMGGGPMLVAYVLFWLPMFAGLVVLMLWSLRRESRIIQSRLLGDGSGAQILPADAYAASRLMPRLLGNLPVLFSQGWDAWKNIRRFQRAGTTLAFYRHRLASGLVLADPNLEAKYVQEFVASRPTLRPAPMRPIPPRSTPLPQPSAQQPKQAKESSGPEIHP